MDAAIELTGAERGCLMLFDDGIEALEFPAARNVDRETLDEADLEISRSVVREVSETGTGIISINAQHDPRFSEQESVVQYGLRSIMATPLRARGQVIGAIYVDNKIKTVMFQQDELDLLEAFATQAAVAIENARLYSQTDQALAERVDELQTLQQIDRELNQSLDLERVLGVNLRLGEAFHRCWSGLDSRD